MQMRGGDASETNRERVNTEILTQAEPRGRVVTDSPRVVKLKLEFRGLDARAEELKLRGPCEAVAAAELARINGRKAEIGWEIFNLRPGKTFQPQMNTDGEGAA